MEVYESSKSPAAMDEPTSKGDKRSEEGERRRKRRDEIPGKVNASRIKHWTQDQADIAPSARDDNILLLYGLYKFTDLLLISQRSMGWLGSRVVSVQDSGAEGPGFKSQPRHCRVTVLGKLFTPIVPLFTKQQNRQQPS